MITNEIGELWIPITGFEDRYEVSNKGRVKSLAKPMMKNLFTETSIMSPGMDSSGHLQVNLRKDGKPKSYLVHRLVMNSFVGKSSLVINHKDGIKTNNELSNLEYCTIGENLKHAYHLGLKLPPDGRRAKLSLNEVVEILKSKSEPAKSLAKRFNVSIVTIRDIFNKRTWKNVQLV